MRIGTRGSALALWQARAVAHLIQETGGPECDVVVIRTAGDEGSGPPDPPVPLPTAAAAINVKRLFVKELEDALLQGQVDAAVHSSKDLPGILPQGLRIAATLAREDPRDALLMPAQSTACDLESIKNALGEKPRIGTSSVRRIASLRAVFPDATFTPIRGNVETRLRKLDAGECDVLVLAVAGLKRLGVESRISSILPVDLCVPAPGQGIVAVEIASHSAKAVRQAIARIDEADAHDMLMAERAVVQALGGGCQMPLGALATIDDQYVTIQGLVASLDGATVIRASARGHRGGAAAVGEKLATQLLRKGAAHILSSQHTK